MSFVIAIDAMGGDIGPKPVIQGINRFLVERTLVHKLPEVRFLLFGDEVKLKHLVSKYSLVSKNSDIIPSSKDISMKETPYNFLRSFKDSSVAMALQSVKDGRSDAVLSAGNTSAIVVLSKKILQCFDGIVFPMYASRWPLFKNYFPGKKTDDFFFLDSGAVMDPTPFDLFQQGILCAGLVSSLKKKKVTIGVLNVGKEEKKGNLFVQNTNKVFMKYIKHFPFEYTGYLEGWDMYSHPPDVVLTDGFTGNALLKNAESGLFVSANIFYQWAKNRKIFKGPNFYFSFHLLRKHLIRDFTRPAHVLGVNGMVYKIHGSADLYRISRAIYDAVVFLQSDGMSHLTKTAKSLREVITVLK